MNMYETASYRKALRSFQLEYGHLITPTLSQLLAEEFFHALEKDPEGVQVIHLIEDWKERLKPMPE
jgi:hypothetical protein